MKLRFGKFMADERLAHHITMYACRACACPTMAASSSSWSMGRTRSGCWTLSPRLQPRELHARLYACHAVLAMHAAPLPGPVDCAFCSACKFILFVSSSCHSAIAPPVTGSLEMAWGLT